MRTETDRLRRLVALSWSFLWISTVTLGGGVAMLPFMQREFVERRKMLSDGEMTDIIAIMHSLPGIIAANMAVLVGYRVCGVAGAVVSAVSACFTPFVAVAALAKCAEMLSGLPAVDHVFLGVRAGTAALVLASLVGIARSTLRGAMAWVLCGACFVATVVFGVDAAYVVAAGFAVGIALAIREAA